MFRARERGMSFWPFAVTLVLLLVFIFLWFSAAGERDNALQAEARAKAAAAKAEEDRKKDVEALNKLAERVGFRAGGDRASPEEIERQLKDYGPRIRDALTIEFPVKRYQGDGQGGHATEEGGQVKVVYLTDAELADADTLQKFLSKFESSSRRMKYDIERAFQSAENAVKEKETIAASSQQSIQEKDRRIAELQGEKSALENQAREKETELNDRIAQQTQRAERVEGDLETLRKQADENQKKLLEQLAEQQGTVRTLVQRDAPALSEGPDGEVVVADAGVAIINRGKANMLMPGTVFDVWGIAKGGMKYKKGTIKVTSADDDTSRASIVEENPRDPIARGDLIQSLTFSPNRKLHFVIVGDLKKMGRSSAEAVLRRLGAVVDAKVSAETNYLVVGAPAPGQETLDDTEAVKTARDLGIRMITEEQLASFTRY